jgi:hypothetical protein
MSKVWRRNDGAFDSLTTPKHAVLHPDITRRMLGHISATPRLREGLAAANEIQRKMAIEAGEKPTNISWVTALQREAKRDPNIATHINHEVKTESFIAKKEGSSHEAAVSVIARSSLN